MRAADNPFRTANIESLRFKGTTAQSVFTDWKSNDFRGVIMGPHGTGKTTLFLETLALVRSMGNKPAHVIANRDDGTVTWSCKEISVVDKACEELDLKKFGDLPLFIDGADLFRPGAFRRYPGAILATSHVDVFLPVLIRTSSSVQLVQALLLDLGVTMEEAKVQQLWSEHGGNVRDIFLHLFDEAGG